MRMTFQRRVQILLDEDRFRRITSAARSRGVSVARVIRDAIDVALPSDLKRKRAALREILQAEPMPVPEDPQDLKREVEETRSKFG